MKKTTLLFLNADGVPSVDGLRDAFDWLKADGESIDLMVWDDATVELTTELSEMVDVRCVDARAFMPENVRPWLFDELGTLLQGMLRADEESILIVSTPKKLNILMKMLITSGYAFDEEGGGFLFSPAGFSKIVYDHELSHWVMKYHNETADGVLFANLEDVPFETDNLFTMVRHGESEGNVHRIFQGVADYALTAKGISQAETIRDVFVAEGMNFDLAISSQLGRAFHTASILSQPFEIDLVPEIEFQEVHNGKIAEMSLEDWAQGRPDVPVDWYVKVGETGESWWEFHLRAGYIVQNILLGQEGHVLCVTHGGVLRSIFRQMLGLPPFKIGLNSFWIENCATHQFAYDCEKGNWQVLRLNNHRLVKDDKR